MTSAERLESMPGASLMQIDGLRIGFPASSAALRWVVDGVSLRLERGEALGLVGESGSGKTLIASSVLGLVPAPGQVTAEALAFDGIDLRALAESAWRELRGRRIAMVFQNPMSAFNPVRTIGYQLERAIDRHGSVARADARRRAIDALATVGIPDPERRIDAYPHEMSGGMLQRAMIALALINHPELVLADEPTTALDATVQAQIIEVLRTRLAGAGLLLVTHNLGVAAQLCRRIAVVYAGRLAEVGPTSSVLRRAMHPYTQALVRAAPRLGPERHVLAPIPGQPPGPDDLVTGCRFARRCPRADQRCAEQPPMTEADSDRYVACWHAGE